MSVHNRLSNPRRKPTTPKIDRVAAPFGPYVIGAWPMTSVSDQPQEMGLPYPVYDYGGFGYHAKSFEATRIMTPFGWGFDFETSFMEIRANPTGQPHKLINAEGHKTWMFLIKFKNISSTQVIMERGDETSGIGWVFRLNTGGALEYKNHAPETGRTVIASTSLSIGVWYRVGISIGAVATVGDDPTIAIYLNGVEDGYSAGGTVAQNWDNFDYISIGKRAEADANFLDATIADIACYNTFFSEAMAGYEAKNLFDAFYSREPFATDLSFAEIIEGGLLAGGVADVSDEIIKRPTSGAIIGGKVAEEPPVLGQAIIGGHAAEVFAEVLGEGGLLAGGIATEEKNFDAQGGFVAGGIANVFFEYFPITPTLPNSGQFLAAKGINQGPFNDWQNPNNITMGLDSPSTASLEDADGALTSHLVATNFNLNIPTGLTVTGIRVTINGKSSNGGRGEFNQIWLTKDGTNKAGTQKTSTEIGATQADKSFGDESDLWGTTWSVAELNDPDFGFAIQMIAGQGTGTSVISVYQMRIDVQAININTQTVLNLNGEGQKTATFNEPTSGGVLAGGVGFHSEGQAEPTSGGILVGGVNLETMAFDPLPVGGALASGEGIEQISGSVEGGIFAGGRATTLYDEFGVGGALLGTTGEWTMHLPEGGALVGGADTLVEITPFHEGGAILGGKAVTGFTQGGGVVLGGIATNDLGFTATPEGGAISGGIASVASAEAFIPTGGLIGGTTAIPTAIYTIADIGTGGLLAGGKPDESPSVFGGSLVSGEAKSFVDPQVPKGGVLLDGEGIEAVGVAVGLGSVLLGGEAIAQEIQEEPIAGGVLVDGFSRPEITPGHEGGALVGGTAIPTANYTIADIATGSALIGGRLVVGIQPPTSGGVLASGKTLIAITETPFGGAILGGAGSQTFSETGLGGALAGGLAESFIDYAAHGGTIIGGLAVLSTNIIEHPAGGALVDGSAQRSTSVFQSVGGGTLVTGNHLLHYNFVGGVNFDDTVSYGGPITMGGTATIVRPTIKFIGDGPVVVSGTAIASFAFSDFEYVPQSAVATVFVAGVADVILTINDQECLTADKRCKIVDKQTSKRRIHCTEPELFAPYCGDLRKGNRCSTDTAVLPAIIACRQRLLTQQEVLDIKNKTVLRNRGNVI